MELTPPPAAASPAEQAAGQARTLIGTLRTALALVSACREIDLAGLDDEVGRMCAAALDLPREQGLALRPLLTELLAEVDRLSLALEAAPAAAALPMGPS